MPFQFGAAEILLLLGILLLLFGPKQLPRLARSIGESVRELRTGLKETEGEIEEKV